MKLAVIPDGWVVVPREPSREMMHSADNMMDGDLAYSDLNAIYLTMIGAAESVNVFDLPEPLQQPEADVSVEIGYNAALDEIERRAKG